MGETYTITLHDPLDDTDDDIAELTELGNRMVEELLPGNPPTPIAEAIAAHRATPERIRRFSWRVRDPRGELVANAGSRIDPDHDDNPDVLSVGITVLPEHRRHGIGARLLREVVAVARAEHRHRLLANTFETVPAGAGFATATGAAPRLVERINVLPLSEVDRSMMEQWVDEGPRRAADYEVLVWDGAIPDEHLEAFVDLVLVMNTAPRDDLEVNDFTLTPAQFREGEERMRAVGAEVWTVVARHRHSGVLAGYHNLSWRPSQPQLMWVGETAVRPEHRGHALGKWLKALLTLRTLDERPQVREIRTGNADSNDAMLGINRRMGYRPGPGITVWELEIPAAEKWLADRGLMTS